MLNPEAAPPDDTLLPDGEAAVEPQLDAEAAPPETDAAPALPEPGEGGEAAAPSGEEDELVITLGDEAPPEVDPAEDTPVIRTMRQRLRELNRENAQLKAATAQQPPPQPELQDPGPMPTLSNFELDGEKYGYGDDEIYAEAVARWTEKRLKYQAAQAEQAKKIKAEQDAWLNRVQGYEQAKKALKVPNFADAEENVLQALTVAQQGLLLKSKEPEKLVYVLGTNPKRLQALAQVADPVDFVYAVAELKQEIKVQQRKKPPVPERVPNRGNAAGFSASSNQLEKLREEAARTGDFSKVVAYKASLKAAQKA